MGPKLVTFAENLVVSMTGTTLPMPQRMQALLDEERVGDQVKMALRSLLLNSQVCSEQMYDTILRSIPPLPSPLVKAEPVEAPAQKASAAQQQQQQPGKAAAAVPQKAKAPAAVPGKAAPAAVPGKAQLAKASADPSVAPSADPRKAATPAALSSVASKAAAAAMARMTAKAAGTANAKAPVEPKSRPVVQAPPAKAASAIARPAAKKAVMPPLYAIPGIRGPALQSASLPSGATLQQVEASEAALDAPTVAKAQAAAQLLGIDPEALIAMMGASRGAVAAAEPSGLSAPVATPAASPELPETAAQVGIVNDGEIDPFRYRSIRCTWYCKTGDTG